MMTQVILSTNTQNAISTALANPGNTADNQAAMNGIASDISGSGINSGTVAWFSQAGSVNAEQTTQSAAGAFIWGYTEGAYAENGITLTPEDVQFGSNIIDDKVFSDLTNNGYVLSDDPTDPTNFAPQSLYAQSPDGRSAPR
jgi:hypothetical protein